MASVQLELDFIPGLTEQFPSLRDLVAAIIYSHRGGLKAMAAELDVSVSHLSRALSQTDPESARHFDINWLPVVIQRSGDQWPISWLIERFMQDPATRRKQVLDQVAAVLPLLTELVAQEVGQPARMAKPRVRAAA